MAANRRSLQPDPTKRYNAPPSPLPSLPEVPGVTAGRTDLVDCTIAWAHIDQDNVERVTLSKLRGNVGEDAVQAEVLR
jgi:hypothetical protein